MSKFLDYAHLSPGPAPSLFRVGETMLWSTYRLASGQGPALPRLFATHLGQVGQGFDRLLKKRDTNFNGLDLALDVNRVGWEVFGGTACDHAAIFRDGSWSWDFAQMRVQGTLFSLPDTAADGWRGPTSRACPSCGAPLDDKGNCIYCGSRAQDIGLPMRGSYTYTKYPVGLPMGATFAIVVEGLDDVVLSGPVYLRFTLFATAKSPVEIR